MFKRSNSVLFKVISLGTNEVCFTLFIYFIFSDEFAEEQEENNLLSSVEKSSAIEVSQLITGPPAKENLKGNFNLTSSSADTAPLSSPLNAQSSIHFINPTRSSHLQQNINTTQGHPASTTTTSAAGYSSNLQMNLISNYPDKQIPKVVLGLLSGQTQADVNLAKVMFVIKNLLYNL